MELIPLLDDYSVTPTPDTDQLKPIQFSACLRHMWFHHRNVHQFTQDVRRRLADNAVVDITIHALKASGRTIGKAKHEYILKHDDGFSLLCVQPMDSDEYLRNFERIEDRYEFDIMDRLDTSAELSNRGNQLTHAIMVLVHRDSMKMTEANVWLDQDRLAMFRALMRDAETATDIPPMVPDKYCNDCPFVDFCNTNAVPQVNCRTCASSTNVGGQFECQHGNSTCAKHVYHPQFMAIAGYGVQSVDPDRMVIDYGEFCNAPDGVKVDGKATMTSREIAKASRTDFIHDERFLALMREFNARLEL